MKRFKLETTKHYLARGALQNGEFDIKKSPYILNHHIFRSL